MEGLFPSPEYLFRRAAYYRALAAKESRPAKIAEYLDITAILENEARPMADDGSPIEKRAG